MFLKLQPWYLNIIEEFLSLELQLPSCNNDLKKKDLIMGFL